MITLHSEELIFLHSLTKSGSLTGLNISPSPKSDEERFAEMEKSLHQHGILKDKQFTDKGLIAMRLIEDYKGSKEHLLINNISVAMNTGENTCVVFDVSTGELVISRPLKATIWKLLIEQNEVLQQQRTYDGIGFIAKAQTRELFYSDLENGRAKLLFYIKRYEENHLREDYIYCEENEKIYRFDLLREQKLERDSQELRADFLKLLQLEGSGLRVR